MKAFRPMFLSMLMALSVTGRAQDAPAPAPAAVPAETEMRKWIDATDAQWQVAYKRDVTDVHEAELSKVKLQFLTSLEAAIAKASAAGDLDGAVALRNEQKRFGETNAFPEQDLFGESASVKQLRAAARVALVKLEKEHAARVKALHVRYDQALAQAQVQLTQRQRLDDALLVKAKRDEIAATWMTPAITAALEKAGPATLSTTAGPKPAAKPKAPVSAMGTRRIVFRATVDAGDNVVIQDGKLHIEHIDWTKPKDISINGIKWTPEWQGNTTNRFANFIPPLAPFAGSHVSARLAKKVKNKGWVKVLEEPTDANDQKFVVHLQDEGNGASDFEVHITW
jgi:hypothetical protein